jgi:outer membrane protein assembly factor BamB
MRSRIVVALLLAAVVGAAPGSASSPPPVWSQFQFDAAHTGYNPNEHALSAGNVDRLSKVWSVKTGAPIDGSLAVGDGLVFVGSDDGRLRAFRAWTGQKVWSARLEGSSKLVASPAFADRRVFAYTSSNLLAAFRSADGHPLWKTAVGISEGAFPSSPTVAGDTVYAINDELGAVDAGTGAARWRSDAL